ncbi:MAG: hypothetical protein Q7V05_02565 [Methanoregula sp.]|nr:hypothetical protein [Methanoregula sp.]
MSWKGSPIRFNSIEFEGIRKHAGLNCFNPHAPIVLSDRETGRDDDEYETELLMAAYVLWAKEYNKKSADEISTELVFLKTGDGEDLCFTEGEEKYYLLLISIFSKISFLDNA